MADNLQVIGSYATVQVTGPTTAVDVLRITAKTIPSGVTFTANAPYRNLVGVQPGDVDGVANTFLVPIATGIERLMGSGMVAGAVAVEDVDRSGLIIDYLDVFVFYSPSGLTDDEYSQIVRIPTQAFDEPSFYGPLIGSKVGAAYDGLKALAAV